MQQCSLHRKSIKLRFFTAENWSFSSQFVEAIIKIRTARQPNFLLCHLPLKTLYVPAHISIL